MPSTYPDDIIVEGGGAVRIAPLTMDTTVVSQINSVGTVLDLTFVTDELPEYANQFQKTEYKTKGSTTGLTLRIAKRTKTLDAVSGAEVASGDAADSLKFNAAVGQADKSTLLTTIRAGTPVVVMFFGGRTASGSIADTEYLIGRISGNISTPAKDDINDAALTISGGESFTFDTGVTFAAFNTALSATITPLGRSAITPTALVVGDEADLKAGKIVIKATP